MLWILNMNLQKGTRECLKVKFKLPSFQLPQFHFSLYSTEASGILESEPSLCLLFCRILLVALSLQPSRTQSLVFQGSCQSPVPIFPNSTGPSVSGDVPLPQSVNKYFTIFHEGEIHPVHVKVIALSICVLYKNDQSNCCEERFYRESLKCATI